MSFGATCVGGGLAWWVPVALSVLVFAGGAQIAAVGVVLSGGSPVAAVLAGAVLNTRLLPYGFAVADVLRPADGARSGAVRGWLVRLAGTHLITDESVAFTLWSLVHGMAVLELTHLRGFEADFSGLHRQALAGAADDSTVITNVLSGRPARSCEYTIPCRVEARIAAETPLPETSARRNAVRLSPSGKTSK